MVWSVGQTWKMMIPIVWHTQSEGDMKEKKEEKTEKQKQKGRIYRTPFDCHHASGQEGNVVDAVQGKGWMRLKEKKKYILKYRAYIHRYRDRERERSHKMK